MRIKANLTQTAIAEQLGVGQSYVSKLERGENYVDVLIFARWCVTCGVRPGLALDRLLREAADLSIGDAVTLLIAGALGRW